MANSYNHNSKPNEPQINELTSEFYTQEAKFIKRNLLKRNTSNTTNYDYSENENSYVEEEDEPTITQKLIGWLWFLFKITVITICVTIIVILGAIIGLIKGISERVPVISDNSYRPKLASQIFDCKGRLIALLHADEKRVKLLTSNEIPDLMKKAVIAIEDERFYQHYGIDLVGIGRAIIKNLKAGRIVQGASTLTQQLIKNAYLTSERSFKRKLIEALMAFQLERKYSKDEILTLYLNEIYFGHGVYGLHAAANYYFNKDPSELTLVECAALAGIPKSPVAFSPRKYPEANKERRNLVLLKMYELGFITKEQYETAIKENLVLAPDKKEELQAPYFVTYVRDILLEKYGANLVYNGGLKIYTTLDLEFQKYAEEAMNNSELFTKRPIDKDPQLNGSLVCIEAKTGYIKAMYGGRDFNRSQFNRVTQAYRQVGSSFKPIVYACALENGFLPTDFIVDEPISYTNPWTGKVWAPKNYDLKFHGTVTLMKALCFSYNIPAVKLIDKLTPAKVIRFARRIGITAPMEANLSLGLGAGNFTPLEMASAYAVFANQGLYASPIAITKIEDRDGNILEENIPKLKEVMKPVHASMITDMLRIAVDRGTGKRAIIQGRAVAGKTGTTNKYVDAWFDGYTPELVTIVQFGYDMPKPLGPKMAGGVVAAPVWHAFMSKIVKNYPPSDFPVPDGAARVKVCMTSGELACNGCPKESVVQMTFPYESIPTKECKLHGSGKIFALDKIEGVEIPADGTFDVDSDDQANFLPEPDFFEIDYSKHAKSLPKQSNSNNQIQYNSTISNINTSQTPSIQSIQSANYTSNLDTENDEDDPLANAVAVEDNENSENNSTDNTITANVKQEPGVIIKPRLDFQVTY